MRAKQKYEANQAAYEARRKKQPEPRKRQPWWFKQPLAIDRLTGWLVVYTLILAIATIISAYILARTDSTLRETLIITQRPWLSLNWEAVSSLSYDEKSGQKITFNIIATNSGHVPAQSVYVSASFAEEPDYPDYSDQFTFASGTPSAVQAAVCRWHIVYAFGQGIGDTIFPNEKITKTVVARIGSTSIDAWRKEFKSPNAIPGRVVLCIAYQDGFEAPRSAFELPKYHLTSKILWINWDTKKSFPVDLKDLKIEEYGSFAN